MGDEVTPTQLEAVAEMSGMGGWGVEDGLPVRPDELGGGLVGLDALGGAGEGLGDGVVELGELAEGQGLVTGGGEELRSQVGGGRVLRRGRFGRRAA